MIPMKTLKMGNPIFEMTDGEAREALNFDKSATPGYILTADNAGNGTKWSPVGLPTDEQTQEAVNAWFDEHPEASTTVQDGSITEDKLNDSLKREILHKDVVRVHFLDMQNASEKYGDCMVVSGAKNGIIDLGYDSTAEELVSYLAEINVNKIDFVVITHYHNDHITTDFQSALDALINSGIDFTDCTFYLPHKGISWSSLLGDLSYLETRENGVISYLQEHDIEYTYPNNDQTIELSDSLSLTFYNIGDYTGYYNYTMSQEQIEFNPVETNYNVFSMITVIKHYDHTFLMTGDAVYPALNRNAQYIKGCDVYKIEHHSLEVKSDAKWLNSISPKIAVVMPYSANYDGENLGLCCRTTFVNLANKGCRMYAATEGTVVVQSAYNSVELVSGKPFDVNIDGMEIVNPILSGTDLDDYTDVGVYASQNAAISASLDNCPYTTGGFRLEVRIPTTYKSKSRVQWLYPNSMKLNTFWLRTETSIGWGEWRIFRSPLSVGDTITINGFYIGLVWGNKIYLTVPYAIPFDKGLSGKQSWASDGGIMIVQDGNVLANSSGFIRPTMGQLYAREYTGISFRLDMGTALTDDTNYVDKSAVLVQIKGLSITL